MRTCNLRCLALLLVGTIGVAAHAQEDVTALARDNIVILLDTSGSMNQLMSDSGLPKMDVAKQALTKVVDQIKPNTNVGLLVFGLYDDSSAWLYDLGPLDRPRLLAAIDRCQAEGATPLGAFMKRAADRLLEQRKAQRGYGSFRLLVVTDGQANDPELLAAYLPDMLSRGIAIDCIGVDMEERHALAERVNSYRAANDPTALERAVQESLAEVGGADASDDVSQENYELAAALDEGMAAEVIEKLATPVNTPIGESPAALDPDEVVVTEDGPVYFGPAPQRGTTFGDVLGGICTCFFVIVVIFVVLAVVLTRASRGRRRRNGGWGR